jgi:hypothetical protein
MVSQLARVTDVSQMPIEIQNAADERASRTSRCTYR